MKKRIVVLIAAFAVGAPLFAQEASGEKPKSPPGTKIAVLDLQETYENYLGVKELRREIELLEPYKSARKINPVFETSNWDCLQCRFYTYGQQDEGIKRKDQCELDKLKEEVLRAIDAKYRDKTEKLKKEIQRGIDSAAKAYGFQIVFGHGNPSFINQADFDLYQSSNRRTGSTRGVLPVYVDESVDITPCVTVIVNRWHQQRKLDPKSLTTCP